MVGAATQDGLSMAWAMHSSPAGSRSTTLSTSIISIYTTIINISTSIITIPFPIRCNRIERS